MLLRDGTLEHIILDELSGDLDNPMLCFDSACAPPVTSILGKYIAMSVQCEGSDECLCMFRVRETVGRT